ncbi:MAG: hypothetical protein V4754_13635 [Pseudomonadota bacterium]
MVSSSNSISGSSYAGGSQSYESSSSQIEHDEEGCKQAAGDYEDAGMSKEDAQAMVAKAERAGIPPAALQQQLEDGQSIEDVLASVNLMSKAAAAGVSPAEIHDAVVHGATGEEIDIALDKRLSGSKQSDLQSISGEPSGYNEIGSTDHESLRGVGPDGNQGQSQSYSSSSTSPGSSLSGDSEYSSASENERYSGSGSSLQGYGYAGSNAIG